MSKKQKTTSTILSSITQGSDMLPLKSDGSLRFKLYSPLAGHPDWNSIFERAKALADEASQVIEHDTRTPDEALAEARHVSNALLTVARSALTNHSRLQRGNHTLLPLYYTWTMHNRCNFRCSYCDDHFERKYFDLPDDGVLDTAQGKRLLAIIRNNTTGIMFCGGEPTLRKDLPELVEEARRLDYFPMMINTNGSRFHKALVDPGWNRLLRNLDVIVVSLDALDLDLVTRVWGVKTSLCEQVMVNILTLRLLQRHVRFKIIVNTVVTPDTIAEADSIIDWANDLGLWFSPVPMNCGPSASRELIDNPDYKALVNKILSRKKKGYKILGSKRLIGGLLTSRPIHCHPSLKPHIDMDGSVVWPCKAKSRLKPVKVNVLDYESLDDVYQAAAKIICVDNIHGQGPNQCGADCNWMQNYVSDIYVRSLTEPVKSNLLLEMAEFLGVV